MEVVRQHRGCMSTGKMAVQKTSLHHPLQLRPACTHSGHTRSALRAASSSVRNRVVTTCGASVAERPSVEEAEAPPAKAQQRGTSHGGRGVRVISPPLTDVKLPLLHDSNMQNFDLAVAGAGPAGMAVAARVSAAGFQVAYRHPIVTSLSRPIVKDSSRDHQQHSPVHKCTRCTMQHAPRTAPCISVDCMHMKSGRHTRIRVDNKLFNMHCSLILRCYFVDKTV